MGTEDWRDPLDTRNDTSSQVNSKVVLDDDGGKLTTTFRKAWVVASYK